jgi:excisionase family DNA binding protein
VAKDTVYRWRKRKGLPARRVGRLWKFQFSEVDAWVRAGGRLLRSDHAPLVASFLHRVFVVPNVRVMAAADLAEAPAHPDYRRLLLKIERHPFRFDPRLF